MKSLHTFTSMGSHCEADLFMPQHRAAKQTDTDKPPVVILAQGYGAERGFGTNTIIDGITKAGIAVFAFDYRGFGNSEVVRNQPRQLIDPARQLEDWQAALSYVQRLPTIDSKRMALWGSSFAGGHVLSVAGSNWAQNFHLKAVVSQIPHCDSRNSFKHAGLKKALGGAYHGFKGLLLSSFGANHTIPIIGKPDDEHFSVLQHPGWAEGYLKMAAGSATWKNEVPAKSLLTVSTYNPIDYAHNIQCPVFLVYGLKDQGIPVEDVERTANLIKHVEHYAFDGDHFEAYDGGVFIQAIVERQVNFLRNHLAA